MNFKRILLTIVLLVVIGGVSLILYTINTTHFRITDDDMRAYFADVEGQQEIMWINSADRQIRYLYQDNQKQNLIIFIHGTPGGLDTFIQFFRHDDLVKRSDLISYDRPGHGFSSYGDVVTSLADQAEVVAKLIRKHGLDKHVILVGHSLGAPIAAKASMQYPTLIDGIVMVGGSIDPELEAGEWYRPWLRGSLGKLILSPSLFTTNEEIYFLKAELEAMLTDWENIQIPMVMIHGEQDLLVPVENVNFAKKMINDSLLRVIRVPDVNHFIPWNRPDLIVDGLTALIE